METSTLLMSIKTFLLLTVFLCIANSAMAQMIWNPDWRKDKTETLEYSNSKKKFYAGRQIGFDTAHAYIRVKATAENEFFYFLEWQFSGYFEDTSKANDNGEKMVYITIQHLMMEAPVKVRIDKSNFEVIIMNRHKLDSLQQLIAARVAESFPERREKPDAELEEAVNSLVSLQVDEKMYGLINEFYGIYTVNGIVPNIKQDLNGNFGETLNDTTVAQIRAVSNEFYVLDDKDPKFYKWRYESKIDWGKMPQNINDLVKKTASSAKNFSDLTTDISINKADKLVTCFHSFSDNGNIPGNANREVVEETIQKIR